MERVLYSATIRPFQANKTPSGSKKKKVFTPASPKSAKAARAERANKRASKQQRSNIGASMSSTSVDDDIQVVGEGDNGSETQHIEPNVTINPEGTGARSESGPGSDPAANARDRSTAAHSRSGSVHRSSEHSQPTPPGNGSSGQEHGDSSGPEVPPQNGGGSTGNNNQHQRTSTEGGTGDDRPGTQVSDDRQNDAKERAIMTALELIEEAHDIMQISGSIRLMGQSKLDAKRLLDNVKACVVELMRLKVPNDDEIFPELKQARRDIQRLIMQSDEFEATANMNAASSRSRTRTPEVPLPATNPDSPSESGSGLRYTLAMRQLDCEIARLSSPRLIDVEQGADVKPDILKDLLKVDVPDIRKSVDRARDALKTLSLVASIADEEKILTAQDVCERAIDWIALVEGRCKAEQLHLDVKQTPREVDFVPVSYTHLTLPTTPYV